jgi:hypothetical protein
MLLKDKLLAALAIKPVALPLAKFGIDVLLRPWPALERQAFQAVVNAAGGALPHLYEQLFLRSACDEQGKPLFGSVDEQGQPVITDADLAAAKALHGEALELIAKEVIRLNGIGDDAEKKAPSTPTPAAPPITS